MYCKLNFLHWCYLIIHLKNQMAAQSTHGVLFVRIPLDLNIMFYTGFSDMQTLASEAQCALMCEKNQLCRQFVFDKGTRICKLGDSANGAGQIARKSDATAVCPASIGYTLHVDTSLAICMKLKENGTGFDTSQDACVQDGGHLVVVDNEAVYNLTVKALPANIGGIWIDGKDEGGVNIFQYWTGSNITWVPWGPGEPTLGSNNNCLHLDSDKNFEFADSGCGRDYEYVCQIDI